eukprot:scaffold4041_cov109-Isochrysis_galbana.AAC.2
MCGTSVRPPSPPRGRWASPWSPRLPSALGLGGAKRTGGQDPGLWTLNPPMRSDSPNSLNPPSPPPPQAPAHMAATD